MTALHMPTLVVVMAVVALAQALAVGLAAWGQGERDGLGAWGLALGLMVLGFGVFALGGEMPWPAWVPTLGNGLMAAAYAMALLALGRFYGARRRLARLVPPVGLAMALSWVLADHALLRVVLVDLLFALQWIGLLLVAWRWQAHMPGRGRRVLVLGAALVAGLFVLRVGALAAGVVEVAQLWQSHAVQVASHLLGVAGLVIVTVGYVLMSKERTDADHVREALIDPLTRVPNRKALLEQLQRVLAQAERERRPVSVLMLDIDHFKRVNDTWGHVAGDAVLAAVAQCLQRSVRGQDYLGRYGGEEFLVVLPGTGAEGARTLAEHLRTRVERLLVPWDPQDIQVTISLGVHAARTGQPLQAVVDDADQAMYAAKRCGRNRVVVSGSAEALAESPAPGVPPPAGPGPG